MKTFNDYLEMVANESLMPWDDLHYTTKQMAFKQIKEVIFRMSTSGASEEEIKNKVFELFDKYGIDKEEEQFLYDLVLKQVDKAIMKTKI